MAHTSASSRTDTDDLFVPVVVRRRFHDLLHGDRVPRALVVGPAGSGKTALLRRFSREVASRGATVVTTHRGLDTIVTGDDTLVVDDAHLLSEAAVAAILERLDNSDSAVIVAMRPGGSPLLHELALRLEREHPPLLLGEVTVADVVDHGAPRSGLDDECLALIVELTGGLSWLVDEAATAHRSESCGEGCAEQIDAAVRVAITHRLASLVADERHAIEAASFAAQPVARVRRGGSVDGLYGAGLVTQAGAVPPVVRSAVRAGAAAEDVVSLFAGTTDPDAGLREAVDTTWGPDAARSLIAHGDEALLLDPRRAEDLYRSASRAGAPRDQLVVRRARAAWARGDLDMAYGWLDRTPLAPGHPDHGAALDAAAAVWSARGMLQVAADAYRSEQAVGAQPAVAALGTGDRAQVVESRRRERTRAFPSTEDVAGDLLVDGVKLSVEGRCDEALVELVRASAISSAARSVAPSPEPPAVVAAVAAAHLGRPETAISVLDDAIAQRQGGVGALDHLLLWRSWFATQTARPANARADLAAAEHSGRRWSARDEMLGHAVRVALARRYDDLSALQRAWASAESSVMQVRVDLFSVPQIIEFAAAAAKVGDPESMRSRLAEAIALADGLGSPLWSPLGHWGAIQQAILLDSPQALKPHAKALIASSAQNPLAQATAVAGRVWTDVLSGRVDVKQVEESALRLARIGLVWDGARLAVHATMKTDDRRVIARLLACARQIHPKDDAALPAPPATGEVSVIDVAAPAPRAASILSAREREVAALVVQGKTYAEIGETIFISPRTAEHHIARIRRRLDATTRSDLIAKLRVVLDDASDAQAVLDA